MARMRMIKPEFWTDESIIECSLESRLFFIGLWNFADDFGNIQKSLKQLKMRIFPADTVDVTVCIGELINQELLSEYSVNGKEYIHINGFGRHQKINRPSAPSCPAYKNEHDSVSTPPEKKDKRKESNVELLDYLNQKTSSKFKPTENNLKFLSARQDEGYSVEDIKSVIDSKSAEWLGNEKMEKYLRPSTLFNAEKFSQYFGQVDTKKSGESW